VHRARGDRLVIRKELAPEITIGTDAGTASAMEKMGAKHRKAQVNEVVVDSRNKILTTPCYMMAQSIKEVATGRRSWSRR